MEITSVIDGWENCCIFIPWMMNTDVWVRLVTHESGNWWLESSESLLQTWKVGGFEPRNNKKPSVPIEVFG